MNKIQLKYILSLIYGILGLMLVSVPLIRYDAASVAHNIIIFLGLSLAGGGFTNCYIFYKEHKLINKVYSQQLNLLSHWRYESYKYYSLKDRLTEERNTLVLNNIAVSIIFCILGVGALFSNSGSKIGFSFSMLFLAVIISVLIYIIIDRYYDYLLKTPLEVIFTDEFVYYKGDIYGLSYSIYTLTDVFINEDLEPKIVFAYSSCTDYTTSVYELILPIPAGFLKDAELISSHFKHKILFSK
ncbi:hypothetical protein AN639_00110 [Candidatus Epulonipiscium fishelsonii]|uniref:Uncharacterized protein n=2 Tax=Candidatus Epulonipiscium fishelsonii TaxID=77094 RepID=A0ACC8XFB3_9FIRM|nr:hypothetical protein AN396_00695 [Epulopiscium sp. SCG-B11WGA-EpuloA1]ONI41618.1 hypothetical protein AN396_03420 [Epulopiscium sp. SCG-B11WGA-EpuloA1]ONI43930.1 hypothetical protein AN639_00110 [Epulopiscium sp. SCG-B05WGA-EpuloA1]